MASRTPLHRQRDRAAFSPAWFAELGESMRVMWRVIFAIMIRESRTRYGSSNIGYAWALIDPVIELSILIAAFTILGRVSPIPVPLPVFLLLGIVPFFLIRTCISRGASAVSANLGLISYPQVMPVDVILARIFLEMATTFVVFILLVFAMYMVIGVDPYMFFGDPTGLLVAILSLLYFALGFGFFSSGLARVVPVWTNVWGYLSRPIWFLSGVFFTLKELPQGARSYMVYNPIAQQLEWIRSAAIPNWESDSYSPIYILSFATVMLVIGLVIDRILLLTGHEEIVS
ncbi:MAG: ABC transporter permease [Parasphingopyxis sp.]|uniref:ABC transporter permease n=1 Tax=Parasphingopyxis sp. TaxID=1920299 RepID=UPI002631E688|nr:ABC transporter permease [uncultured Parasphingopyxis sp.]